MVAAINAIQEAAATHFFIPSNCPPGFPPARSSSSNTRVDLWFYGTVQAANGPASIYLHITDLSFIEAPSVYLSERPHWLKGWHPHLTKRGLNMPENLCYSDHEKYQLLPQNPAAAIARVIRDTADTLTRIAKPESAMEDSQREIAAIWGLDAHFRQAYIDIEPSDKVQFCSSTIFKEAGTSVLLVSENAQKLATRLNVAGKIGPAFSTVIYPQTDHPLYITSAGTPTTESEIQKWLKSVSSKTYNHWHDQLKKQETYRKEIGLHLFRTQGHVIGYLMHESARRAMHKVRSGRQIGNFFRDYIYGGKDPIFRISAMRIDEEYLVRRNLRVGSKDLRGTKILLIGCGAIGGYLAQSLVQLGAGIPLDSTSGSLTLCDSDTFLNTNIGRHLLGFRYLGIKKADALKSHLTDFRPSAIVNPEPRPFHEIESRLSEFDVIIDAGGYESLSRHLSKLTRENTWFGRDRALLSIWIEGQGGVTRCLLQDSARAACYDCMWNYSSNTTPTQRYKAYTDQNWTEMGSDGYATMTPYAVSAPQTAAALAIDALLDWRAGSPSPRFRSRSSEGRGIKASFAKDLDRGNACPGCGT